MPTERNEEKIRKNEFFDGILEVTDEKDLDLDPDTYRNDTDYN